MSAAPAGAATQIGQLVPPSATCGPDTVIQSSSPGGQYAAPFAGVLTSWSYFANSIPPTNLKLKIARPAGGDGFSIVGESPAKNPAPSVVNTYTDVRIPVQPGDVIGYHRGSGGLCFGPDPVPGAEWHSLAGDQPPGPTVLPFTPHPGSSFAIAFAAILEPDCDADGFGDETQDGDISSCSTAAAPDTTITKGPKDKTKKKTATFEFTSSVPGATFECSLDDAAFAPCTSPAEVKVKKGKHNFRVQATSGGQPDGTPASDDWKVKKKK